MKTVRILGFASLCTLALAVPGGVERLAHAWEAAGNWSMRTRAPHLAPGYPFGGNFRLPDGARDNSDPFRSGRYPAEFAQDYLPETSPPVRIYMRNLHHTHTMASPYDGIAPMTSGGFLGPASNLFLCRAQSPGGCTPLQKQDVNGTTFGWVNVRKSWTSDVSSKAGGDFAGPEHMMITQWAASAAGFDVTKLFNRAYWLRYPTRNRYIASPYVGDISHAPPLEDHDMNKEPWVVGPSYLPQSFATGDSLIQRGVYLPELAQLPDMVWSVSDWASGAETCPIATQLRGKASDGTEVKLFGDANEVNACHDYAKTQGPVNASHFLPAARHFYKHYHDLALARMAICKDMATKLKPIYDNYDLLYKEAYESYATQLDTEYHECEREALVFEMFAIHYLEDSWSSGHMWRRWGSVNFDDFPERLAGYTPPAAFLETNKNSRRLVIGEVLASVAGALHGAKSLIVDLPNHPYIGATIPRFLANDPLNYPFFDNSSCLPRIIQTNVGETVFPVLGDNYFSPPTSQNPSLRTNPMFVEQKKRLLSCVASSLREAYLAGPQAHGPLAPAHAVDGITPDLSTDPRGNDCWEHLATNESMEISLGPVAPLYVQSIPNQEGDPTVCTQSALTLAIINEIPPALTSLVTETLIFPDASEKKPFLNAVANSVRVDSNNAALAFEENSRLFGVNDTRSARLLTQINPQQTATIDMLNVGPLSDGAIPMAAVSYADRLSPRPDHPEDHYVARMFWRSHLAESCREPQALPALRNKCIGAASQGGDPTACTACTELAEAHIPPLARVNGAFQVIPSKCEALGQSSGKQVLPASLWDKDSRLASDTFGATSYQMAYLYCTDTTQPYTVNGIGGYFGTAYSNKVEYESACSQPFDPDVPSDHPSKPYEADARYGVAVSEHTSDYYHDASSHGLHPVISAINSTEVLSYDANCNATIKSPELEGYAHYATSFPFTWRESNGLRQFGLHTAPLAVEFCGVTQRVSWWNRGCDHALNAVSAEKGTLADGEIDARTGLSYHQTSHVFDGHTEDRCELTEPIQLRLSCRSGLQCNSNGFCGCTQPPEIVTLSGGSFDAGQLLKEFFPKGRDCGGQAGSGGQSGAGGSSDAGSAGEAGAAGDAGAGGEAGAAGEAGEGGEAGDTSMGQGGEAGDSSTGGSGGVGDNGGSGGVGDNGGSGGVGDNGGSGGVGNNGGAGGYGNQGGVGGASAGGSNGLPPLGTPGIWPDSATRFCATAFGTACPGPGEATFGQDGNYLDRVPVYVPTAQLATDSVTGLQWQRAVSPTPVDLAAATAYCDGLQLGGFGDWRLPSRLELLSLLDLGASPQPIAATIFQLTPASPFWTSTPGAGASTHQWQVDFGSGNVQAAALSAAPTAHVRCTRGPILEGELTLSPSQATVLDTRTGLEWERDGAAQDLPWSEALARCEALTLDGYADWQLPALKDLLTLVGDTTIQSPLLSYSSGAYWSSSPVRQTNGASWAVLAATGQTLAPTAPTALGSRCVRSYAH